MQNHSSDPEKSAPEAPSANKDLPIIVVEINASGHVQQLDRNFSLLSICGVGLVSGNTWAALGGTIAVAIFNGGPAYVIYEFLVVSVFYFAIAASIAELASAVPSSSGVYQWASITAGRRYGRVCGLFAGYWNFFAWIVASASVTAINANIVVQMYALNHAGFVVQKWHVFVTYQITMWCSCCVVLFANRTLPAINNAGIFFVLAGVFITIIVCAVMPGRPGGNGYATNAFVWKDWSADIGYSSKGFIFLMGMLNGAFAVGVPDLVTHLAEELPRPEVNVPKAIAAQTIVGFFTALCYMIAMFYAISDLDAVVSASATLPLAEIYRQATGSAAGSIGLLAVILISLLCANSTLFLTTSRTLWTLARDGGTPFSHILDQVNTTWRNPFNAILTCGFLTALLGCLYVGSSTAFNAFVGSFVILSTLSYIATILPHLLSRRANVNPGPFWMKGSLGFIVNGIACSYIAVFVVIYCFPYSLPVTATTMNYSCVITGGLTVFVIIWWTRIRNRGYKGPPAFELRGVAVNVRSEDVGADKV